MWYSLKLFVFLNLMHIYFCYTFRDEELHVFTQLFILIKEIHGHTLMYLYTFIGLYKYTITTSMKYKVCRF